MSYAPVALFVYNRPSHTRQTIDALKKNKESAGTDLHIFCDGPKSSLPPNQLSQVKAVRDYVRTIAGFNSITLHEHKANKGLANSIIYGVTTILKKYTRVIVLEDDLVTSSGFLNYMNVALDIYEENPSVISVHAYNYPVPTLGLPETFFIRGADCWGWATWRRGWNLFEADGSALKQELTRRKLLHQFNINGSYPFIEMLTDQIEGRISSWAIRWHASAFLRNKLTLYPAKPLVLNIGFDSSGTHTHLLEDRFNDRTWNAARSVRIDPKQRVEHNSKAYRRWQLFFEKKKISRIRLIWDYLSG
jgi:hypothetical protein